MAEGGGLTAPAMARMRGCLVCRNCSMPGASSVCMARASGDRAQESQRAQSTCQTHPAVIQDSRAAVAQADPRSLLAVILLRVLGQKPQHAARGQLDAAPAVPTKHADTQLCALPSTRRVHAPTPGRAPPPPFRPSALPPLETERSRLHGVMSCCRKQIVDLESASPGPSRPRPLCRINGALSCLGP